MKLIGKTIDNQDVFNGVFKFYDTHGLPMSVIIELLKERNAVPCYLSFLVEATYAGWSIDKTKTTLREAVADVYGREYQEVWLHKFDEMVKTICP